MSTGRERSGITPASEQLLTITFEGRALVIDPRTFTMAEQRRMRGALHAANAEFGIEPDEMDFIAACVWTVARRDDVTLTFDEVSESLTIADITAAKQSTPDADDPET